MFSKAKEVKSESVVLNKGQRLLIHVDLKFESDDIHLNDEAPNKFTVKTPSTIVASPAKTNLSEPKFDVICTGTGSGEVRISANLYYCDVAGACSMGNVDFVIPVVEGSGVDDSNVSLTHSIPKFT